MGALVAGQKAKDGHDISDILRGKISVYMELKNFRETLLQAEDPENNGSEN